MAERGTLRGELVAGWQRFWGLSWKVKGPAIGVVALLTIAAGASGGSDDKEKDAQASTDGQSVVPLADIATEKPSATTKATNTARATETPKPTNTPRPTATATTVPPTATPTEPPTAVVAPCTVTATVSNASPVQNASVTVTGVLACPDGSPEGAAMTTSWQFASTTSSCDGVANASGVATCSRQIGQATTGRRVPITVTFTRDGKRYQGSTGFTPQ